MPYGTPYLYAQYGWDWQGRARGWKHGGKMGMPGRWGLFGRRGGRGRGVWSPVWPAQQPYGVAQPIQLPPGAVPLERLPAGTKAKVVAILAGFGATDRAFQMGIAPGSIIEVVENNLSYPWTPVLVKVNGTVVAIGRGFASRVFVEPLGQEAGEKS